MPLIDFPEFDHYRDQDCSQRHFPPVRATIQCNRVMTSGNQGKSEG
jgi:hypothetical protein